MHNKWNTPHHLGIRLLQSAAVIGCTGLLYLQTTSFPSTASVVSVQPTESLETLQAQAPETEAFSPIEGSLPSDGDYESALLRVLQSRPLYATDAVGEEAASALAEYSKVITWDKLEGLLTSMTEGYEGTWSIYVKDLATEDTISLHDESMEAASLIKLYIMGAVMEQIQLGNVEQTDQIDSLLNEMITVSDNEASNELVRYMSPSHDHKEGMAVVNDFIRNHGFTNTIQVNGLADTNLWYSTGVNQTSAKDCGKLLEEIYKGNLVSHLASRKMEDLLMAQDICYKIPDALPSEAVSASKTGEVTGTENDTAIVYSKGGDFILCIMSTGWSSQSQSVDQIHEITKTVYGYFNPEIPPDIQIREAAEE